MIFASMSCREPGLTEELRKALAEVHDTAEDLGITAVLVGALIMEFKSEIKEGYPGRTGRV